jgi:hypothetical protein
MLPSIIRSRRATLRRAKRRSLWLNIDVFIYQSMAFFYRSPIKVLRDFANDLIGTTLGSSLAKLFRILVAVWAAYVVTNSRAQGFEWKIAPVYTAIAIYVVAFVVHTYARDFQRYSHQLTRLAARLRRERRALQKEISAVSAFGKLYSDNLAQDKEIQVAMAKLDAALKAAPVEFPDITAEYSVLDFPE